MALLAAQDRERLEDLRMLLERDGVVSLGEARLTPLSGGVSCDVVLVESPGGAMVVKRALEKLRVKSDWRADPARNRYEHLYMSTVAGFLPGTVPKILHTNDTAGYFCMEWLGAGWENWKEQMLGGVVEISTAKEAARVLGIIHRETSGRDGLRGQFDTTDNFHALRLDPYLLSTAAVHPDLSPLFHREVARIADIRECLVHGDYSPKNLLVRQGRIVVLDCEVAWFGDPRFDLAFLLNHLFLKSLFHAPRDPGFDAMLQAAVEAYFAGRTLGADERIEFEESCARLVPMLMLARVDGKSPVEYLDEAKRRFLRETARVLILERPGNLRELRTRWFSESMQNLIP